MFYFGIGLLIWMSLGLITSLRIIFVDGDLFDEAWERINTPFSHVKNRRMFFVALSMLLGGACLAIEIYARVKDWYEHK